MRAFIILSESALDIVDGQAPVMCSMFGGAVEPQ